MKKIDPKQYAQLLYELTSESSKKDIDATITSFVELLGKRHSLNDGEEIASAFNEIALKKEKAVACVIKSKHPLTKDMQEQIIKKHKKDAQGMTLEVMTEIDESLIGGYTIRIGDVVYDHSISANIAQLTAHLVTKI